MASPSIASLTGFENQLPCSPLNICTESKSEGLCPFPGSGVCSSTFGIHGVRLADLQMREQGSNQASDQGYGRPWNHHARPSVNSISESPVPRTVKVAAPNGEGHKNLRPNS